MNTINNNVQTTSPAPWKKTAPLLILGLALLLWGMSTQAATYCNAVTEISTIECESLLELYHSTNGAEWNDNEGWNVTNTPCSWYGVTCEKGGVTDIRLGNYNNLKGTLPNFKGLPNLQTLSLSNNHNQLTGAIPDFSALPNLQELSLGGNQLTGAIPDFSALPKLERLDLYNNQLTGAIPDFSALPKLRLLYLFNNQLTGAIPNFSALPKLSELYLFNNQLTGAIPDFSALPNLSGLELSNNQLTGAIPDFSALPQLEWLYLYNNQLTGAIPNFSALPNLQRLYLYNNQLTGAIPDFDFSALTKLKYLDLRNNPICKDTNINYSSWPIKHAKWSYNEDEVRATWQEELDEFPNCPVNPPPTPVITVWPTQGVAPLDIELDASNSEGSITQYAWTINGQTLSGQTTSTTLTEAGEYTLTLTVTDPEGQTATTQQSVFVWKPEPVNPPPIPVFTVWPPHGMTPLTIDLDASDSEGSITQYAWTINGQTLSGQTNSITLTEVGEHTLVLTVTGNDGQTATTLQSVFVWQPGQAIIIAGPNPDDNLFKHTNEFTQRMYRLLKQRGYDDDKIHYLNVLPPDIEPLDGRPEPERQDYNLFDPKKELSEAFAQAAADVTEGDQFVFYLHGHAGPNRFKLLDEKISAAHLRDLLATLPAGVQQIIILDTCYAGSFMDELAGVPHRLVVTSTDDKSLTFQVVNNSFANEFMHILESGGNVFEAFRNAEDMILKAPKYFTGQRPWLDDDNDGQFLNDGLYAENVRIGLRRIDQAPPPKIKQVHPRITLPENESTTTLWVNLTDNENIHRVRAILIPPQYEVKAYQGEDTDFNRIEVPMQYNPVEDNYGVKYDGFCANAGLWQILYQAQDTEGAWSEIVQGEVQAPECLSATVKMQLNQSRYTSGNPLRLDMQVNGQERVDLYVAIIFPEGYFMTIAYPLAFSWINAIQVYQPAVEIAGQKTYSIMDFPLPAGIPTGGYQACGVLVLAGNKMEYNNWIDWHCAEFEVY